MGHVELSFQSPGSHSPHNIKQNSRKQLGGKFILGNIILNQSIHKRSPLATNFNITDPKDNLAYPIILKIRMRTKVKDRERSWVGFHFSLIGPRAKVFLALSN